MSELHTDYCPVCCSDALWRLDVCKNPDGVTYIQDRCTDCGFTVTGWRESFYNDSLKQFGWKRPDANVWQHQDVRHHVSDPKALKAFESGYLSWLDAKELR